MRQGSYWTDFVTNENRSDALDILRDFSTQIPRAAAPRRLALTIATGALALFCHLWSVDIV